MNPAYLSAILAGLALVGQLANYLLNLKIRNGQLELERRIRDEFVPDRTCSERMENLDRRLVVLESRRV